MSLEIERKFKVLNDSYKLESFSILKIKQGFLNSDKNRVVRIRVINAKGYITVKGISSKDGTSRFEWEKEIPLDEAESLLQLCEKNSIEKNRYLVNFHGNLYEVDEFLGENKGLIIAEIELTNPKEKFKKPIWLGTEVTGIVKYYNSELSKKPFKFWE